MSKQTPGKAPTEDDVLRRMLASRPSPHKEAPIKRRAAAQAATAAVSEVKCPCCDGVLFRMQRIDNAWIATPDSPRVEPGADGHFIKCPHCSRQIAMLEEPSLPGGAGYSVSPAQNCA